MSSFPAFWKRASSREVSTLLVSEALSLLHSHTPTDLGPRCAQKGSWPQMWASFPWENWGAFSPNGNVATLPECRPYGLCRVPSLIVQLGSCLHV